ncbi:diacylglycerol kinase family protein [Rugosimonospora acidiphila]|uniref:Diacylglycerol kinase family protein n=1 Tax=Rugosimonospora acidiphila TaxID=556531 RepID=A0ABP9RQR7_9ACTN
MRALLVVNHRATTTSGRVRDVLVQALRSVVNLEVAYTQRRGHAAGLSRQAAKDGMDVVVALGGDGTVNEIVNGLLSDGPGPRVPALAVVPGGSTNVFARALGLPNDWVEATGVLLEALREHRSRTIGLGRADDRYFTFCAGYGLDAEVIRKVEQARRRGTTSTPTLYVRALATQYLLSGGRNRPKITLERPGEIADTDLDTAIVQNTTPWTYLGNRPVDACPDASFDLGLDMLGVRALHTPGFARTLTQLLLPDGVRRTRSGGPRGPHGKSVLRLHDSPEFTLRGDTPRALQLDGEYLGETDKVRFVAVPAALRVIW